MRAIVIDNSGQAIDAAAGIKHSLLYQSLIAHAAGSPKAPAVIMVDAIGVPVRVVTYGDLLGAVATLAERLYREIEPRAVVVLRSSNSPEYIAWFVALLAAGLRVLPTHPQLAPCELGALCRAVGAVAVVAEDPLPDTSTGLVIPVDRAFVSLGCAGLVLLETAGYTHGDLSGELLLQSSGSTGEPKLVVRSAAALDAMAVAGAEALGLSESDRVVLAVPLCHSYGVDLLLASLYAGAAIIALPRFDAPAIAELLSVGGATVFPGVPFMFESLARISPRPEALLRPRLAVSAGAPLPRPVRERMQETWGLDVVQLFGATELGTVTLAAPGSGDALSVGLPLRGVSVRIVGVTDPRAECPPGHEGQVLVRAPTMLSSYFPDQPPPLLDGHFLTGDLGYLDDRGRLVLTGRVKLLMNVGGLKVNPVEVEGVLDAHPGVKESMVSPMALSPTVNRLHAAVVPSDPADPPRAEDLRAYLQQRLAPYKVPRMYEVVHALPRSPGGKLVRAHLTGRA
jgi:long-chain acyl-CoA synthetase